MRPTLKLNRSLRSLRFRTIPTEVSETVTIETLCRCSCLMSLVRCRRWHSTSCRSQKSGSNISFLLPNEVWRIVGVALLFIGVVVTALSEIFPSRWFMLDRRFFRSRRSDYPSAASRSASDESLIFATARVDARLLSYRPRRKLVVSIPSRTSCAKFRCVLLTKVLTHRMNSGIGFSRI